MVALVLLGFVLAHFGHRHLLAAGRRPPRPSPAPARCLSASTPDPQPLLPDGAGCPGVGVRGGPDRRRSSSSGGSAPLSMATGWACWSLGAAGIVVWRIPGLTVRLARKLRDQSTRRWFNRVLVSCEVISRHGQIPTGRSDRDHPGRAAAPASHARPGSRAEEIEEAGPTLAATIGAREVRVLRDPDNASLAHFSIIWRDALSVPAPPWPVPTGSLWEPISLGIDEDGNPVRIGLPERNLLLGGEPGAGKSAALSLLIAAAALDPSVHLTLLDGKQVELAPWSGSAEHFVGPDMEGAIGVLKELCAEMDRRYATLLAAGLRKIEPGGEFGLHVVAIDELAFYMRGGKREERTELTETLRDLISRGRAAGIIVIAATQKPSNEIIPTFVRDLFSFRMALRCTTPEASDTVLGQGWASQGYSASTLDPTARGVGFLLAEGAVPVKIRTHYLDDDAIAALDQAGRADGVRPGCAGEVGLGLASRSWPRSTRPAVCAHPIRLRGITLDRVNGELVERGILVPCKDRRAAVCPSCSRLYQADAWQLVAAGIRGGKGVSPDVVEHPQLFVTLTAPSFGAVHSRLPEQGGGPALPAPARCRPCPHGGLSSCCTPARRQTMRSSVTHCARTASTTGAPCCGTPTCPGSVVADLAGPLPRGGPGSGAERPPGALGGPALLHQGGRVPAPRLVHVHLVLRADGARRVRRALRRPGSTSMSSATPCAGRSPGPAWRPDRGRRPSWPGPRGAPSTTSGCCSRAQRATARPWRPTSPSTPPRRPTGPPWLAHPIRSAAQLERLGCGPTSPAWCGPPGPSGGSRSWRPSACGPTPTRSATPASSPPRACATRPPSRRCASPGPLRQGWSRGRARLRRGVALRRPGLRPSRADRAGRTRSSRRPGGSAESSPDFDTEFDNAMTRQNAKRNFSLSNLLSKRLSRLLSKVVWRDGAMTPRHRRPPSRHRHRALARIDHHLAQ